MLFRIAIIVCILLSSIVIHSQGPVKNFDPDSLPEDYFQALKKEFGLNKTYPAEIEKQVLIALSWYPELKNTPIKFRIKRRHSIALTRATFGGILQPAVSRHYVITISDSTESILSPILFKKQSFNAQVGIIGHELAHVVQYSQMNSFGLTRYLVSNISAKYVDRFEFNADAICIAHGLGYQLLAWSSFIRKAMNTESWRGPDHVHRKKQRERYMNPATILKRIEEDPFYRTSR
jgi:hypothetical protein